MNKVYNRSLLRLIVVSSFSSFMVLSSLSFGIYIILDPRSLKDPLDGFYAAMLLLTCAAGYYFYSLLINLRDPYKIIASINSNLLIFKSIISTKKIIVNDVQKIIFIKARSYRYSDNYYIEYNDLKIIKRIHLFNFDTPDMNELIELLINENPSVTIVNVK